MRAYSRATTMACLFTITTLAAAANAQTDPANSPAVSDNTIVVDLASPKENVILNGPLLVPIGQVVDIAASQVTSDSITELTLSVQSVDGKQLAEPVTMAAEWLTPDIKTDLQTSMVRLRGYQGGEFRGALSASETASSDFKFEAVFVITGQLDTIGPAEKQEIEGLIDQLALEDDDTFLEQSKRFVKRESSMRIEKAVEKLVEFGRAAWPILTAHFSDPRPAVVVQPTNSGHTVGVMCIDVIRRQIINVPEGYPADRTRKVKDGSLQLSPRLTWGFHPTLKDWLKARKDKPLKSIQVDVLLQLLAAEDQLGYPNEVIKSEIRTPLIEHLNQLRGSNSLTQR